MQGFNADSTSHRELPENITIPPIRGEMARLRPATIEDLAQMDALRAFDGAAVITGKDSQSERAMVHAWVNRSVQWSLNSSEKHETNHNNAVEDAQSRPTIAWSLVPDFIDDSENINGNIIGMIFLIDIDGWSKSARIQVILGRDYRGRGYSRDAMPRVMTYGFAPSEVGLALHRIWVGVPATNTRSLSVYQSLGFMKTGTARDALWDSQSQKYQDFVVMDTLVDEYDAIRSLDAFGLHVIEDNPGVCEALSAHEHSIAIPVKNDDSRKSLAADKAEHSVNHTDNSSKRAWWRIIGRGRKRAQEDDAANKATSNTQITPTEGKQ
ncbi:acetyltransferase, GNAT family [Gardnerella vaginalis JCP8522]|nr:acetyltransferase, GNAT family [Gardnerella vaginalis JCP8522]